MLLLAGGLVVLVVLLLAIPVNVVYALKREGAWRGRILVYWLFGYLRFSLRPGRRRKGSTPRRILSAGRRISRAGRGAVRRRRDIVAVLRTPGLIRRLVTLFQDMSRALRPRRLRVRMVIGMEDPADTGRLWGLLAPLRLLFGVRHFGKTSNVSVEITPDFVGPRLTVYSCASVQFVPLTLIGLGLGFALSTPVLRAMRTYARRPKA